MLYLSFNDLQALERKDKQISEYTKCWITALFWKLADWTGGIHETGVLPNLKRQPNKTCWSLQWEQRIPIWRGACPQHAWLTPYTNIVCTITYGRRLCPSVRIGTVFRAPDTWFYLVLLFRPVERCRLAPRSAVWPIPVLLALVVISELENALNQQQTTS